MEPGSPIHAIDQGATSFSDAGAPDLRAAAKAELRAGLVSNPALQAELLTRLAPSLAGKWIALEGVDAAGKTTQLHKIASLLRGVGAKVELLPELSDSPIGQSILSVIIESRFYSLSTDRSTPLADTLSMMSDLAYSLERVLADPANSDAIIISDRGPLSTLCYQGHGLIRPENGPIADTDALLEFGRLLFKPLRWPASNILLTLTPDEMQRRLVGRGETLMSEDQLAAIARKQQTFRDFAASGCMEFLAADGLSPVEVSMDILLQLENRFCSKEGENH